MADRPRIELGFTPEARQNACQPDSPVMVCLGFMRFDLKSTTDSGRQVELSSRARRIADLCVSFSVGSLVKDTLERAAQDAHDFDYDIGW